MSDIGLDDEFNMDDEEYDLEYSEDSNSEPDVDLENQYYNSKALKEEDPKGALKAFSRVLELEEANGEKGDWGFKALKQMIKIHFRLGNYEEMMERYKQLLTYIKNAVTRNYSEKSINSILDYISTSKNMELLQNFYETTLEALKDAKNDRLWFKTNTKLGKLYFDREEFGKLAKILKQLHQSCLTDDGEDDLKKGTQLLEIYALEIQMCTAQKNNKRLKSLYEQSLHIKSAIPHPLIMGVIRECGGKMHLREGEFEKAHTDFFEAFKNYDESGSPRRTTCLKYLVLANMLMKSGINPFDSQEAKPYKNDPEILAMTNLVSAYQNNDIADFEKILKNNRRTIMDDPFIREHIEDLLRNVRTQVLMKLIKPYTRIHILFISQQLNIDAGDVESLLVSCILDNSISGRIDQVNQVLQLDSQKQSNARYSALDKWSDHVKELRCGKMFYRTFYMDPIHDVLYVGAMDHIFRLPLKNISLAMCEGEGDVLVLEPSNVPNCISKGKSEEYECHNHVRVIQPMGNGDRLYICGTNAHQPKDLVIYSNLTHLARQEYVPGVGDGIAKCPFDPNDNSTAVWVEEGNPGGLPGLYSGTVAEFTKADTVIFRMDLYDHRTRNRKYMFQRTIKYDSKWLDKPNFVGSYDMGDYVYFFFRETAVEYMNCGKAVYSRVARVCKSDTGGKNTLRKNWVTFLKARLNCSIPGEFPFYFNEIQGIYKVPGDNSRFYAAFTTSMNGLAGSAICTFTLRAMEEAFQGKFKEQATSSSAWLPVLSTEVPEPRPGTCIEDTQKLPDSVLNFVRTHPLMDEAVNHEDGKPVFYKRDTVFTHIVVDKVRHGYPGDQEYTVYFAATNKGEVYKIVQWYNGKESQTELLDVFHVTDPEPIRVMEISSKHKSLYVASDSMVKQVDLVMCTQRYDNCLRCIKDPYCGWEREAGICRPYYHGLLQDVSQSNPGMCDNNISKKRLTAHWGQSVHLACDINLPDPLHSAQTSLTWYHHSREKGRYPIELRPGKYIQTSDQGLVIVGVTEADAGRYDCLLGDSPLCSYNITVDSHRCAPPGKAQDYQKVYSDWCHQFEKYKLAMETWKRKQAQCGMQKNGSMNQLTGHPNEIFQRSPIA
ncbi:unnamed protein product [Darwinula stevensoni]|uniref:COP9 signalosome complex subunit 2 n=1 Tax=Darwinula stevensoni TaxID=69355 RepID=A0A7R8XFK1_9CRUS|nr:unnamed protein product [Darwinula stevensoni]CAG0890637.1 unnamed protein product [Darwinula stevensoni]